MKWTTFTLRSHILSDGLIFFGSKLREHATSGGASGWASGCIGEQHPWGGYQRYVSLYWDSWSLNTPHWRHLHFGNRIFVLAMRFEISAAELAFRCRIFFRVSQSIVSPKSGILDAPVDVIPACVIPSTAATATWAVSLLESKVAGEHGRRPK